MSEPKPQKTPLPGGEPARKRMPEFMDDASTSSSLVLGRSGAKPSSSWTYYLRPVYHYLRGLGCPEQDLDDLTHEVLIKLNSYIIHQYDPTKSFRPYFKSAIRNLYFDHCRDRPELVRAAEVAEPLASSASSLAAAVDSEDVLVQGLIDFARQTYDEFLVPATDPALATGIKMLRSWIIDGFPQQYLSLQFKLSDRQVRTHLVKAADAVADWMQRKINREDLDELQRLARAKGVIIDLEPHGFRSLFSHVSKKKRVRVLLVLMLIYRQEHGAGPAPRGK